MRRREFIAGLGGAAVWPPTARGQQPDRMRRVGVLSAQAMYSPTEIVWPVKYVTILNLRTAKELGLTVPPVLLVSADDVIE